MVNFPQQNNWQGLVSEMEVVPSYHVNVTCDGCDTASIAGKTLINDIFLFVYRVYI